LLGYYALFGEHRLGRADLWERFLQVKDQLPDNAGRGGIGTPDRLRAPTSTASWRPISRRHWRASRRWRRSTS
jgi:hypothetical protein